MGTSDSIRLVPEGPSGLTASWLTTVLTETTGRTVDVAKVETDRIGTGQTGTAYRLTVTYETDHVDLPSTFVAKLPALDPDIAERVAAGCKAEVAFYQRVADSVRLPLPRCYFSAYTDDGARFVLLLADLTPAVQGDQLAGCSAEAARPAAIALAGLHGPRWCDPEWLSFSDAMMPKADEDLAALLSAVTTDATKLFLEGIGPRLSSEDCSTLEESAKRIAPWLLLYPDRFALLHGDYRLDNLLFAPSGDVTIVDWQTLAVGLPARDLAYFISTSLDPAERASHERGLVEDYHRELVSFGVEDYDLETCWQDYRIGMLQVPLIATLGWAYTASTDRGDDMMQIMAERACVAIRELETLQLIDQEAAR